MASPSGGKAPVDGTSISNDTGQELLDTRKYLENTVRLHDMVAKDFDAIFLPGGHGTMFDFPDDKQLQRLLKEFYETNKVVAAVCHGPAGFVGSVLSNGKPLVAGKRVTAFTNAEEKEMGLEEYMPFLLETRLCELGAEFYTAPNWEDHVQVDENLITGQNPQSSLTVAQEVIKQLG